MAMTASFENARRHQDLAFAIGILGVLAVLFLPMPSWALDAGLTASIALSFLILLVALWIEKPLDFSSFPVVLLVATMFRLALNIASTRLILSEGHTGSDAAGGVIEGLSNLIISGNFVIGLIVFAILITVNFVVITKGATRIAEVGARFTLDAIPGKQMAIDADLSAGLIDDKTARTRRKQLEDESSFFGSMDGASKFVRGDAIAGLIITAINIIGGMIIGVVQMGLDVSEAAASYTILTVGDGLASQVPALVVSLAAGLLVAKGSNIGSAHVSVVSQLGGYPKALMLLGGLMLMFALMPGLPSVPFFLMGGAAAGVGWMTQKRLARERAALDLQEEQQTRPREDDSVESSLKVDDVEVRVGSQLLPLIASPDKGLAPKVKSLRLRFARELGFLLPSVRIRDDAYVAANQYVLLVHDVEVARGEVRMGRKLVINPNGGEVDVVGEATQEPTFGLPAKWVDDATADSAEARGLTVVDPESVIITHLAEVLKGQLHRLLNYAAFQRLLDNLDPDYEKLMADIVPTHLSATAVQRVLQNLLVERVSIRNFPLILEAISEAVGWTRNITLITEHVRTRLAAQISAMLKSNDGFIPVIALSPKWEQAFLEHISSDGEDRNFAMPPSLVSEFVTAARSRIQQHASATCWPALLVGAAARPFVRSLLERVSPTTPILSHNELDPRIPVSSIDQL
ncbi:flagellar biosynthesis protein FlhA [Iodidimonas muriae]|uniref:Flagellar biosynthesis protein FlhA n=1 Tax=Iodidimonas muriae TaxID=261467 RepID=A0ABQ2LG20_9PROT|nr:flagellar biosynthesis protein FlhA [Iodidimonas muriae]GER08596.1 flagellar biosynthesis protein FlhA [Kordiimonadales bacterium JCM 17843]GGO15491.1 flagellar biosynthesis protein FlhA [Iodidimonas muriae]